MTPIGKTHIIQASLAQTKLRDVAKDRADDALREVAQKMEANFLAEMLKHSGFGEARTSFGGGSGEDQFGSFLRQAYADEISETSGIGLAEHIFESLKERQNGTV